MSKTLSLAVRQLLACGASHEVVVRFVEEVEASKATYERDRKRAYRSRMSRDNGDTPSPSSPPMINNSSTPSLSPPNISIKSAKKSELDAFFEREFWPIYPRRVGKGAALKAFRHAICRADPAEIVAGLKRYVAECRGKEAQFIAHPTTWLNQDRWLDEYAAPSSNVVGFRKELPPEPPAKPRSPEEQAAIDARVAGLLKPKRM